MKKALALLMCLALLACGTALAGEAAKTPIGSLNVNGAFDLQCALPEGYQLEILSEDGAQITANIYSGDAQKPTLYLSIGFDELMAGVNRMNDLSDEELARLQATFTSEDHVSITYRETSHGTKLMVIREDEGDVDFVDIMAIYLGYSIEFVLVPGEAGLSEEQIQMAVDFLSDLDFVPAQ